MLSRCLVHVNCFLRRVVRHDLMPQIALCFSGSPLSSFSSSHYNSLDERLGFNHNISQCRHT